MNSRMIQAPRIQGTASLETAARFMLFCDADRVEVVDAGGRSKGIVTERDVIRSIARGGQPVGIPVQELLVEPGETSTELVTRARTQVPLVREPVAHDVMSSPAVACAEGATLHEVAELLADREISGLPVVDEAGSVVGVISERDLAHALGAPLIRLAIGHPVRSGSFLRQPRVPRRAGDIMSAPPVVGRLDTSIHELASWMIGKRINRIPIVDGRRLVGIVTRGDILAAVAALPDGRVPAMRTLAVGKGAPS